MNKSFVYFVQHSRNPEIRVGFTGADDGAFKRLRQHATYGFDGITAIVPGTIEDEKATHALLAPYRIGPSIYGAEAAVVEYVEALLLLGRAAPTESEAQSWPALPFNLWRFGSDALCFVDPDGQPSLFRATPVRERLEYAHQQAILQSRGDEWFTPPDLIERARSVMGGFDLDPASNHIANRTVRAGTFYTKALNGLNVALPWHGRVWLNPPYGVGPESAGAFVERLIREWQAGTVTEAITCLNLNSMSSEWFQPLYDDANAHVVLRGRPSFIPPSGIASSAPTKGTVLSYFGPNANRFAEAYGSIGTVLTKYECVGHMEIAS